MLSQQLASCSGRHIFSLNGAISAVSKICPYCEDIKWKQHVSTVCARTEIQRVLSILEKLDPSVLFHHCRFANRDAALSRSWLTIHHLFRFQRLSDWTEANGRRPDTLSTGTLGMFVWMKTLLKSWMNRVVKRICCVGKWRCASMPMIPSLIMLYIVRKLPFMSGGGRWSLCGILCFCTETKVSSYIDTALAVAIL